MAIRTARPHAIDVHLGPALRRIERPRRRSLVRPALQGLATGVVFGLAVGSQALPSTVAVFALGGLALFYALMSFHLEEP